MFGKSILVVGQGRVGKSGLCFDLISGKAPDIIPKLGREKEKWIIISPRKSHPYFYSLDRITDSEEKGDEPLREKMIRAYNESKTHLFIRVKSDNAALFDILGEENEDDPTLAPFYSASIYIDEVGIVLSTSPMENAFKNFIRVVGQNNQILLMSTHRITGDTPPIVSNNTMSIYLVGSMPKQSEAKSLYDNGNMEEEWGDFWERIRKGVPKYDWWDKRNPAAITVIKETS